MAMHHARSGEVVALPLGAALEHGETTVLVMTGALEVVRLVVPAGKAIATHRAPGPITVQCLEGRVWFTAHGTRHELDAGKFLHLAPGEPHALEGIDAASLLLTIIHPPKTTARPA